MLPKIFRPDSKKRITLGHLADGISGYTLTENQDRELTLKPLVEVSIQEKWLLNNEKALKQVKQGLKESKAGKLVKKGSFSQYIDDNAE